MPPRNHNQRGRGQGSNHRGNGIPRGRGRGRGGGIAMMRPGAIPSSLATGSPYRRLDEEFDYLGLYGPQAGTGANQPRGNGFNRGRGRARADFGRGSNTPTRGRGRGRGDDSGSATPNRRGFGSRGTPSAVHNPRTPLSTLLHIDRPFLRPIKFVKATQTPILFQQEEEIFQAVDAPSDETHVPTAERVARVFSGQIGPSYESQVESDEEKETEDMMVVQFDSLSEVLTKDAQNETKHNPEEIITAVHSQDSSSMLAMSHETVADIVVNAASTNEVIEEPTSLSSDSLADHAVQDAAEADMQVSGSSQDRQPLVTDQEETTTSFATSVPANDIADMLTFIVDTTPSAIVESSKSGIEVSYMGSDLPLGSASVADELDSGDDVIVYDAPNPRSGNGSSTGLPPAPSSSSAATGSTITTSAGTGTIRQAGKSTPRSSKRLTKIDRLVMGRKRDRRPFRLGMIGALNEERHLHNDIDRPDPRKEERRIDDSDLDWGSESDEVKTKHGGMYADEDELSASMGAMELDPDVAMDDTEALRRFVKGMVAASNHVTIDDLQDAELLKAEDEDEDGDGDEDGSSALSESSAAEDSDVEDVVQKEEMLLIGEAQDDDGEGSADEGNSTDYDLTPGREFQARLANMRRTDNKGKGRAHQDDEFDEDSSDEDEDSLYGDYTRGEEDDDYIDLIEQFVDENRFNLSGRGGTGSINILRAIRDGKLTDIGPSQPAKPMREKIKDLPDALQAQWERDRQKKAANKAKRAQARLEAAASPFAKHKGGKKGMKDMIRASRLDPSVELPNRITDLPSIVEQIRVFIQDLGGQKVMSLPPMARHTRKQVHELALVFGLKSKSVGKEQARYTSLTKTSRTGIDVKEFKIATILRRAGFEGSYDAIRKGKGKAGVMPKHREGDVVGKAAPKIGDNNIGFQMLAAMGWSEGDRIGVSGGIDAPLTAIIKTTKLGLGATR